MNAVDPAVFTGLIGEGHGNILINRLKGQISLIPVPLGHQIFQAVEAEDQIFDGCLSAGQLPAHKGLALGGLDGGDLLGRVGLVGREGEILQPGLRPVAFCQIHADVDLLNRGEGLIQSQVEGGAAHMGVHDLTAVHPALPGGPEGEGLDGGKAAEEVLGLGGSVHLTGQAVGNGVPVVGDPGGGKVSVIAAEENVFVAVFGVQDVTLVQLGHLFGQRVADGNVDLLDLIADFLILGGKNSAVPAFRHFIFIGVYLAVHAVQPAGEPVTIVRYYLGKIHHVVPVIGDNGVGIGLPFGQSAMGAGVEGHGDKRMEAGRHGVHIFVVEVGNAEGIGIHGPAHHTAPAGKAVSLIGNGPEVDRLAVRLICIHLLPGDEDLIRRLSKAYHCLIIRSPDLQLDVSVGRIESIEEGIALRRRRCKGRCRQKAKGHANAQEHCQYSLFHHLFSSCSPLLCANMHCRDVLCTSGKLMNYCFNIVAYFVYFHKKQKQEPVFKKSKKDHPKGLFGWSRGISAKTVTFRPVPAEG